MSTTQPEALRENHTAADMATAAAQGFRDGVASAAASAGSEPVAWLVCTEEGDPSMVFLDRLEACQYCEDDDPPKPLYTHPSPPEGAEWRQGVEAAAALLSKKADDFAQEHGYDDMGSLSFGRGAHADAKLEYHSTLLELAEEIRSLAPPAQAADSVLEDAAREVLMEHSGCGSGTQVDMLTVRLNPGDKVVMLKGRITQAIDAARKQGDKSW